MAAVFSTVVNLVVTLHVYNAEFSFQLPSAIMNALNMWNGRDHSRAAASVHTSGEVCIVVVVECLRREMPRWLSACMFLPILMGVGGHRTRGKFEIAVSSTMQITRWLPQW